jgi:hypothetical protein
MKTVERVVDTHGAQLLGIPAGLFNDVYGLMLPAMGESPRQDERIGPNADEWVDGFIIGCEWLVVRMEVHDRSCHEDHPLHQHCSLKLVVEIARRGAGGEVLEWRDMAKCIPENYTPGLWLRTDDDPGITARLDFMTCWAETCLVDFPSRLFVGDVQAIL